MAKEDLEKVYLVEYSERRSGRGRKMGKSILVASKMFDAIFHEEYIVMS